MFVATAVLCTLANDWGVHAAPPTDCFDDSLPKGALARFGTVRLRHGGDVDSLVFSSDGKLLATGGSDRTVRIWDATTGKELRRLLGHRNPVRAVAFSPDGKLLASSTFDDSKLENGKTIRLWNVTTGKEIRKIEDVGWSLVFSPDGDRLAAGFHGVRVWAVATGKRSGGFSPKTGSVSSVVLTPNGEFLALGCDDKVAIIWDVATGKELHRFQGQEDVRWTLALSPDCKTLATRNKGESVSLWDVASGKELRRLRGHDRMLHHIAFSPEGKILASGSWGESVRLWDVATGKEAQHFRGYAYFRSTFAFSPDGKMLAVGHSRGQCVRLWDTHSGKEHMVRGHGQDLLAATFSPDGKTAVSVSRDATVCVWEPATGKEIRRFQAYQGWFGPAAFSRNGKVLAGWCVADKEDTLRLWDVATGKERCRLEGELKSIKALAFSQDGKLLAAADEDRSIRLWDAVSGKLQRTLIKGKGKEDILALAWSPDGKALAGGSRDRAVYVWDTGTGERLSQFFMDGPVWGLAFSPNGHYLAAGAEGWWWLDTMPGRGPGQERKPTSICLFDIAKRQARHFGTIRRLEGVHSLNFSPDSKSLAAGNHDGTVVLWDAGTGKERRRCTGHQGWVRSVCYSPDGKKLLSAGADTTLVVWDASAHAK
jgi:WD40 repeat protein